MISAKHQLGGKRNHVVNDACEQDINEGDGEVEEEPDVDHLDVRGDRKASNNRDEHAGEDQHDGEVDSNGRFKIERFEVVGDVTDDVEKNCWDVHGENDTKEPSAKHNSNWK